jgi:hypothetical protein
VSFVLPSATIQKSRPNQEKEKIETMFEQTFRNIDDILWKEAVER